jgi:two-component system, sensor histidine kinase and response regulator
MKKLGTEPVKILLVDDHENNLTSMEIVLENQGYVFTKARSGREVLKILLKEDDFSLILLDVKMPVMDGYETAELIYQREKLRHIPIIFITAHDYEEEAMFKGYQSGAVDYIRKPFKPQILRAKVAVFAELHKKNNLLRQQREKVKKINKELIQLNHELEERVQDRTQELKTLNEDLKQLNLSKDKILSVISHDLRNPLTALYASSTKLSSRAAKLNAPDIHGLSEIISRTSKRVIDQLNELVEWSKQQSVKVTFNPTKIQLMDGMNEAIELLKNNAQQKRIELRNEVSEDIYVNADPLMLGSIVQNIITNAIKYTPEHGLVTISAHQVQNMVEVSITDTGIGMSPEKVQSLFTETDFISSDGTNDEKGSGLGLLLVREFVVQHGGSLSVESEPGKGSCFCFTIPANKFEKKAEAVI